MSKDISNVSKHILVDSIFECVKVVEEIIIKEKIISIDCEGVMLSKEGRLTLIQVFTYLLDWIK
jgi:hypothetical protein